jgi:hypothetical protein
MTESMPESGPLYDRYGIGISRGFVDLRPGTRTRRSMNAVTQRLGAETNVSLRQACVFRLAVLLLKTETLDMDQALVALEVGFDG